MSTIESNVARKSIASDQTVEERFTDNAIENVLPARYLEKDENGEVIETPDELFQRVARNIAEGEYEYGATDEEVAEWEERFYEVMTRQEWMPNSPTLMNAGAEIQQLSACFVDSPADDMADIFQTAKEAALVMQSGGGMGYSFTDLRPKGDVVSSTGGIASGPVSFMKLFDATCFHPTMEVLTSEGKKQIQNVEIGDLVVNGNGELGEVADTNERYSLDEMVVITPDISHRPIRVTKDHEIRVRRDDEFQYIPASEIDRDTDELVLKSLDEYNSMGVHPHDSIDLSDILSGPFTVRDNEIELNKEHFGLDKGTSPVPIDREISGEDLATLAGWYLAEGSISYQNGHAQTAVFTLNIEEKDAANDILNSLEKLGIDAGDYRPNPDRNLLRVEAHNSTFAQLFLELFGSGASEKHLPAEFWNAQLDFKAQLIKCLFEGDGTVSTRGASQRVSLRMASKDVIDYVFQAGLQLGVQFGRYFEEHENKHDVHSLKASTTTLQDTLLQPLIDGIPEGFRSTPRTKEADGEKIVAIDEIAYEKYDGPVYDLTVSGDPSYVVEDVVVHNCGTIKQGGTRRGAQMAMLRADHPDIGRFCVAKRREGAFANFNISVLVTDEFVEAWENDESYTLYNPRTDEPFEVSQQTVEFYSTEYEDADPAVVEENFWRDFEASITGISDWKGHTDLVVGEPMELPAGFIWDILIDGAWRNGEPGLAHIDRINREHSFDVDQYPKYQINSTNPCGEQPLCEYEACTLGHINLSTLVRDDAPLFDEFSAESDLDFESRIGAYLDVAVDLDRLDMLAKWGTRFLDNVNTQSAFPIDEISERVFELRKIGVGIMGYAQLLIQLGVEYGSEESQEIARQLMARIDYGSKRASHRLAEERGSFDAWEKSKYADPTEYPEWFEQHVGLDPDEWADGYPIRNHNTTTIAPTGTTSIIANTSGGCEPIYRVAYFKNAADDIGQMVEFDDLFVRTLEENGYDVPSMKEGAEALMNSNQFTVERLAGPEMASMFKTADRITPEEHIAVQAAFQEHVDSSISKSVNLPNEATHDDVRETYELALSEQLKAVAIYRDGSREDQVQTDRADNKLDEECPDCGETLIQAEGCEKCPDESCGFAKCDA